MNAVEKNKNKLFGFIKNIKEKLKKGNIFSKIKMLIVVVLMLIVVVIFASSFKGEEKIKDVTYKNNSSAMEYCEVLENRLINVIKNVKGIGNVEAFVMVDSSPTIKYLEETSTTIEDKENNKNQTIQTKIVLAKNGSVTTPVVVVEKLPKITGVMIVASGAKDVKLKTTLINAVSAVLNVDIARVEVLEGKK